MSSSLTGGRQPASERLRLLVFFFFFGAPPPAAPGGVVLRQTVLITDRVARGVYPGRWRVASAHVRDPPLKGPASQGASRPRPHSQGQAGSVSRTKDGNRARCFGENRGCPGSTARTVPRIGAGDGSLGAKNPSTSPGTGTGTETGTGTGTGSLQPRHTRCKRPACR